MSNNKTISIIVPVFNEEKTISLVLKRIISKDFGFKKEIVVVNDGSKDKTLEEIKKFKGKIRIISYKENKGKGYAIRKAIEKAKGDIIAIQDADLEYNLDDLKKITNFLIKNNLDVVYGSRFLKENKHYKKNSFYFGNKFLSFFTSLLFGQKISDMETCYKVFKKEIIKNINLTSNGFEIEAEITAKILKKGYKIYEVPISYKPRTKKEGKKIKWRDGLFAIRVLLREKFNL